MHNADLDSCLSEPIPSPFFVFFPGVSLGLALLPMPVAGYLGTKYKHRTRGGKTGRMGIVWSLHFCLMWAHLTLASIPHDSNHCVPYTANKLISGLKLFHQISFSAPGHADSYICDLSPADRLS